MYQMITQHQHKEFSHISTTPKKHQHATTNQTKQTKHTANQRHHQPTRGAWITITYYT